MGVLFWSITNLSKPKASLADFSILLFSLIASILSMRKVPCSLQSSCFKFQSCFCVELKTVTMPLCPNTARYSQEMPRRYFFLKRVSLPGEDGFR